MRIQGRTGAVHRPRRPIIGSPDAQPAATPDTAVGDGTSFLRLPRHPRPLPVSGGRPAEPRRRRRRNDALDRPRRSGAARHGGARGPASSGSAAAVPSPWLLGAIAAFALLIVVSAIPNSAGAVAAAGKLSDFAVLALGAAAFVDTRQRFADLAGFLVGFCTVAVAWGAVEFVVNGGERQGSFMGEHDLAALSTMALVLGLAYLFDRDRRPPAVGLVGDRRRRASGSSSARRWRACSASTSAAVRWSRSRSCAATCAAAPSSSRC